MIDMQKFGLFGSGDVAGGLPTAHVRLRVRRINTSCLGMMPVLTNSSLNGRLLRLMRLSVTARGLHSTAGEGRSIRLQSSSSCVEALG